MTKLKKYESPANNGPIWYKVISGRPHPFSRKSNRELKLGIAFRTEDAPIGYFPFYAKKDFDYDGQVSFAEEWIYSRSPINMSDAASPHTALIKAAAGDVEFLGAGDEVHTDITKQVHSDLLKHAMTISAGVFVDSIMMSLGGPTLKGLVGQFTKSRLKQFVISKYINQKLKEKLKQDAGIGTGN